MSKFYVETEDETSLTLFQKRVIYELESVNEEYKNLVDFNFGEKFLYGRVKRNFIPMYFNNNFVQLKSFAPTNVQNTPLSAINFVVDMFERLRTQFLKCSAIGTISPDDPFLSSLKIFKAYQNPVDLHNSFLQTYLNSLASQLKQMKYKNLQEFMIKLEALLRDGTKLYPITFSGFVKSRFCPITVSGLAIEIADAEYFNDNRKIEEFINSPNWEFYLNACRTYGFMVDKLVPWRLVADIGSSQCLEYSKAYNLDTTDSILSLGYERTDLVFFKKLKFYLINLYNQNANTYAEPYDCNGIQKIRYVETKKITVKSFDEELSEIQLLNFYFKLRIMEEESNMTENERAKLIRDCSELYFTKGLSASLNKFELILGKPFDKVGSLSYLYDRSLQISENT